MGERIQYSEPDWNVAPEWANYWAVDMNGNPHWFECMPGPASWTWECQNHTKRMAALDRMRPGFDMSGIRWWETVRARPSISQIVDDVDDFLSQAYDEWDQKYSQHGL